MTACKLFTGGNKSIHFLDLSWNHIRLSGAVGLCKGLQRNTSIINMNLAWNGLAFQGSLAIEEMLKQNTCLKFFDVSNNRINWEGVSYVAKGLKRNGTLQMLKVTDICELMCKRSYSARGNVPFFIPFIPLAQTVLFLQL